jgi:hypothetical protein
VKPRITERSVVRALWMLACLLVIVGAAGIWWPGEQRARALESVAAESYDEAVRNESEIRQQPRLQALAARVTADLRRTAGASTDARATTEFVALLSHLAQAHHIEVRALTPVSAATPVAGSGESGSLSAAQHMELALGGSFANVLDFIADLPRQRVLVGVDDASLAIDDAAARRLNVTLHVTLYRYDATAKERSRAATD